MDLSAHLFCQQSATCYKDWMVITLVLREWCWRELSVSSLDRLGGQVAEEVNDP